MKSRLALLAALLLVAACSGDDDDGATTDITLETTSESVDDSVVTETSGVVESTPTTTGSTGGPADTATDTTASGTTTTLVPTTTTVPSGPTYPLTGLPMDDEGKGHRPALVVKMDNHPQARPQTGLNQADIVFEENVERLTRFAAVFQSGDSEPVGPVRSGRTQDIDLLASFNHPMFAWSGGNPAVTRAVRASELVDLSWTVAGSRGGYHREPRPGIDTEHTLFASTVLLYQNFTPLYAGPPPPQFTYRKPDEAFNGEAGEGAQVSMDGVEVIWRWDADNARYLREQAGQAHMDSAGVQVNAANVVILEVQYLPSPADRNSPEAQTVGYGPARILTAGVMIEGIWERLDRLAPFTLRDVDGNVVALTPGRTWVELSRFDKTLPL